MRCRLLLQYKIWKSRNVLNTNDALPAARTLYE